MKLNKKRLLVLSSPVGSGHIKAAEALCQVAIKKFNMKAFHVNFLEYLNPKFSELVKKGWYLIVKYIPLANKVVYKSADRPNKSIKTMGNFFKINIKRYNDLIEEYKPDIIISTHYIPAAVVSWMYDRFPITNGVTITDFESHSMWVYPNNNKVFVACKKMISELTKMEIEKSKICISGIPVRLDFGKHFDVKKIKKKLGLDLNKPILLVMSGGDAVGPFTEILKSLALVKGDFQVLVIAGKNETMRNELERRFKGFGLTGKVLGFVENIEDCMAISNLLISKAGGLTTAESLVMGLPILIIRPTPGQEDGNVEFLTKAGAAIYVKNVKKINLTVEKLLKNPKKIARMKKNAKKLAQPKAAEKILKEMIRL